ncbi:MAG TPA: serine/threonine-protein kinase [Xanthomonadaceae bacterium]|nr:serine/threonine-protein kinase [Xanthomonadaceae bacterium]
MSTSIDDGRWQRLAELFDQLADAAPQQRDASLRALSEQDPELAAELAGMLHGDLAEGPLDHPLPDLLPQDDAAADPVLPDRSGHRVGPYLLVRTIGRGGMGEVYLAERVTGDFAQRVAIKLLKRGMDSHALLSRFARERRILAQLDHPNIAHLLDGGICEDGTPYFAMEYVDGRSITEYARAMGLDPRARVELLLQAVDAVAYAQSRLVVHRDIKPSNLLVDAGGRVRVLDFGIAKLLDDSEEERLTGTGTGIMTPTYAAPEQIRGEVANTATDVYALGGVLFELLTGREPHPDRGHTPVAWLRSLEHETGERPSAALRAGGRERAGREYGDTTVEKVSRVLRGDLDTIVSTALQPDARRRYAGAAQLAQDLRRYLEGRPIAAQPDTATYRLRKFAARHRYAVGGAVAVLVALLAGLGLALWQAQLAREHALRADAEAARATRQAEVANAVSEFLTRDLIQAANPFRSPLDIALTDALVQAGTRIDARFAGAPVLAGVLHRELAQSLYLAGDSATARAHAHSAVAALAATRPVADPELLQAYLVLGQVLRAEASYAEARNIYGQGLAVLPAAAPDALRLAFEVGLAGIDVEDRREARALRVLQARMPAIVALGAFEQLHIDALDHRLRALMQTDRFEEALVTARELRSGTQAKFGVEDPRTLEWQRREAVALTALERYAEALPIMERACATTVAALGSDHPAAHECRLRHGVVLFELQRFEEAAALIEQAANYRERSLGADNENTWIGWVWLARCWQRSDRIAESRALFERTRDAALAALGPEDPNAMPFEQVLGMHLEQTGQFQAAAALRRSLLEKSQRVFPDGHVSTAKYAWDLGETLASQRRDREVVAFYGEWLPHWEGLLGPEDSRVVDARAWLAAARARLAASQSGPE